jgi:hypothetical protein
MSKEAMTQDDACSECSRAIIEPPWSPRNDLRRVHKWRALDVLRVNQICFVCWDHRDGAHQAGYRANCIQCQLEKKRFKQLLADRVAQGGLQAAREVAPDRNSGPLAPTRNPSIFGKDHQRI